MIFSRASRFAVFAVVLAVLALGLAATNGGSPRIASANGDDAHPQLFAPNPAWDWTNDGCPDVIDSYQGPELRVGDCTGATWKITGSEQQFPLDDVYNEFLLPGDWNLDDCPDIIATQGAALWLIPGDCNGIAIKPAVQMPGDWSGYNYFIAPGKFNDDLPNDLIARKTADGSLWLLKGDGGNGFSGDPVQIGTGFDAYDIIMGVDVTDDGCTDLLGRSISAHTIQTYTSDCAGNLVSTPSELTGGGDLAGFDWLFAGADWAYAEHERCNDIMGWKASDPGNLSLFMSNCNNGINLPQKIISGGWGFPFAGDSAKIFFWGESDCNGQLAPRDGQSVLKFILESPAISQQQPCPGVGAVVYIDSLAHLWGDWDCDGQIGPRDAQDIQKVILGNPPLSSAEDCPVFGLPVGPFS
ncbi:MAG: hypothetical protein ABI559_00895 [Chloroflexota bacterium]